MKCLSVPFFHRWGGVPRFVLFAGLLSLCALLDLASGFEIDLLFDTSKTDTYIDPDGIDRTNELTAIMQAAAANWKDLIQDDHTLTLTFWWEDIGPNGIADHGGHVVVDGREISANLRFTTLSYADPNNPVPMPWWLDPSPLSDTEFAMTQILYRNLTPVDQSDYFNGSPPETFEAGYQGSAKLSAPIEAQTRFDLLSSALHEIGHALGLTNEVSGSETSDNDYDIDPGFVRGAVMAVETQSPLDRGHLKSPSDLMTASGTFGVRRRPAAADILSMAAGSGWTDIDLPRQDFLGGSNWNDDFNWLGGKVPDVADSAFIRPQAAPSIVHLTTDSSAAQLLVGEGSLLSTNANLLKIGGTTTIDEVGSQIFVNTGGTLRTNGLVVSDGAELDMTGGLAAVNNTLLVSSGSTITGNGTIDVVAGSTNSGLIIPDGGTLTLTTAGSSVWDLDGPVWAVGGIDCSSGDLTVVGTLTDSFDGIATVGEGHTMTFNDGWTLGSLGTLNLNGTPIVARVVGQSEIRGDVVVSGTGEFFVEQIFRPTSLVQIPLANDLLALRGITTFDGFAATGNGVLQQFSDVTVMSNTAIDVATYDWGNSSEFQRNDTTIDAGVTFTVNSNTTGSVGNPYRGVLQVNSGVLEVNTSGLWTLPSPAGVLIPQGTLNLVNNGGGMPIVRGAPLMVSGDIDVSLGTASIEADLQTTFNANITANPGADLVLSGTTTFSGGNIAGLGEISQGGDIEIIGDTTIGTAVFDWGNSIAPAGIYSLTVHPETTLTVGSASTGTASNDFRGNLTVDSGTLIVSTSTSWTLPTASAIIPSPAPGRLILTKSTATTPTIYGTHGMFVAGSIEMQGTAGQLATPTTLQPGGAIQYKVDSQLQLVNSLIMAGGTFDHGINDGLVSTSPAAVFAYEPGATIQVTGEANGSLTFDLAAGTTVIVEDLGTPTLTITPGATLIAAGATDPFTNSSNPLASIDIENNSTESLSVQVSSRVGTLTGVGKTIVDSNFSAAEVSQDTFAIDQSARFTLYQPESSITTTTLFKNSGTVTAVGDFDVWGPTENIGIIELPTASSAVFHGPLIHNKGEFVVPGSSILSLEAAVEGDGAFDGQGLVRFGNRFDPGDRVAEVAFKGSVAFQDTAILGVELGGTTPGSEFDLLTIVGSASLSGTVEILLTDLGNGVFMPAPGKSFMILSSQGGVTGTFADEVLPTSVPGVSFRVLYDSNSVTLFAGLAGDFDQDNDVDGYDFLKWQRSESPNPLSQSDLDDWQSNYGMSLPLSAAAAAVPEPTTLALLSLSGLLSLRRLPRAAAFTA